MINFVYVSRVMLEKGFEEYVYSAKEIKKSHDNVVFHVCGMIEQGYEEAGRIRDVLLRNVFTS